MCMSLLLGRQTGQCPRAQQQLRISISMDVCMGQLARLLPVHEQTVYNTFIDVTFSPSRQKLIIECTSVPCKQQPKQAIVLGLHL